MLLMCVRVGGWVNTMDGHEYLSPCVGCEYSYRTSINRVLFFGEKHTVNSLYILNIF